MRVQSIVACALGAGLAFAFQDTSPLFAYVSSASHDLHTLSPVEEQLSRSSKISASLVSVLEQCPTEAYILVSQPSVSANDFGNRDAAPHLYNMMSSVNETTSEWRLTCSEVVGEVDLVYIKKMIMEKCGAKSSQASMETGIIDLDPTYPQVVNVDFPALQHCSKARVSELSSHDSFLNAVLTHIAPRTYSVIYSTSPVRSTAEKANSKPTSKHSYSQLFDFDVEDSYPSAMHTDLKRDLRAEIMARANETVTNAPLFETYAFLNPGIFMGLLVVILLLSILYVGMSAIGSLEISVAAFSKEMGPAAQKKQLQQQQ